MMAGILQTAASYAFPWSGNSIWNNFRMQQLIFH